MEKLISLIIVFSILGKIASCNEWYNSCMNLYKEGGVTAVLRSAECSFEYIRPKGTNHSSKCQFATLQGRREYQEDRVLCDLDVQINLGNHAQNSLKIGLAAIFDGHGGKEASELSAQLFPFYFQLHLSFLTKKELELSEDELEMAFPLETEANPLRIHSQRQMDELGTLEVLKEAMLLTIHDIDSTFSQVAVTKRVLAGTTATIAVVVDGKLLVGNVGDSKALLCSERTSNNDELNGTIITSLQVTELTEDHHPDRVDEKARIEAAGGFVSFSGVPRVNGILAVSRSIGDVYLKRYGVIAEPEITGWRPLNDSDVYVVVASDGIFESLSMQDVCNLLQNAQTQSEDNRYQRPSSCLSSTLAECIVYMAFEKGSRDNLSAIVVPLRTNQ